MMPMRANIVGPPDVATRIKASMAALPLLGLVLGLRKLRDVIAGNLSAADLGLGYDPSPRHRVRPGKKCGANPRCRNGVGNSQAGRPFRLWNAVRAAGEGRRGSNSGGICGDHRSGRGGACDKPLQAQNITGMTSISGGGLTKRN